MIDFSRVGGFEKAIVARANSNLKINELAAAKKDFGKGEFVQFFDPSAIISKTHILGAYISALNSFKEKMNIAKSLPMEMLLFVAMTDQISNAIKMAGAKSSKDFVLFATSKVALDISSHSISIFGELEDFNAKAAVRYGLRKEKDAVFEVLNAMTLSRILSKG
ncbi:MAG: KEOPS complex subunit Cgi121 [Candidatus Micrarchaeia archaeon]